MNTKADIVGKIVKFCEQEAIRTRYSLGEENNNPVYEETGVLGLSGSIRSDYRIGVDWLTCGSNSYLPEELTLATPEEVSMYFRKVKRKNIENIIELNYPLTMIEGCL